MYQVIKTHLKKQRSNYIFFIFCIVFSTYLSTINICKENTQLIHKKYESLKFEVLNQRLFMKKLLDSPILSDVDQKKLKENLNIINLSSTTNQDFIKVTSDWISIFKTYLTLQDSSNQLVSEKSAYSRLISLGLKYNLDLDKQITFSNQFLAKILCSKSLDENQFYRLSSPNFDISNFLIVL